MPTERDNDEERSARIDRLVEPPRTQNANSEMRRGLPSRAGDVMLTRASPADGDVVVDICARQEARESALVYVQNAATGADQYRFRIREEAIAYALPFAKCQHVRAWLTDNWVDFVPLEDFRMVESV
jgi:hypothetical protein